MSGIQIFPNRYDFSVTKFKQEVIDVIVLFSVAGIGKRFSFQCNLVALCNHSMDLYP